MLLTEYQISLLKQNRETLSEIQKRTSDLLQYLPTNKKTIKKYKQIYKNIRLQPGHDLVQYAIDHTLEENTFYQYKAGYQYFLAKEIDRQIENFKADPTDESYREIELEYQDFTDLCLRTVDPDLDPQAPDDYCSSQEYKNKGNKEFSLYPREEVIEERKKQGSKRRKKGKKHSICRLQKDWQLHVMENLEEADQMPFLLSALTGCRPAELDKKVEISKVPSTGFVKLRILGAKLSKRKGQEWREITFDPGKNLFARILEDKLSHGELIPKDLKIKEKQTKKGPGGKKRWENKRPLDDDQRIQAYCDRVRYVMQRKLGMTRVSPYSVRHQAASDFKMVIKDPRDISKMLGHRSFRMIDHYGRSSYGRGGQGVIEVDAAHKVIIKTHQLDYMAEVKDTGSDQEPRTNSPS
jgi:integrase